MIARIQNPQGRQKKMAKTSRKKRRSPAQIRATKKLVALNKKRRAAKKRKSNPSVKPKRRRVTQKRRPIMAKKRRTTRKRRYTPVRRARKRTYRRRKNPTINFMDIIQSSIMSGIGGLGVLFGSNAIAKALGLQKDNQKNLISLSLAVLAGVMLPRYMKGGQADSIANGAMAVVWLKFIKNFLPENMKDMFMLGDTYSYPISTQVDKLVDSVLGEVETRPSLSFMGEVEETFGMSENNSVENMIHSERW